jgi:hypothetical protein
MVFFNQLLPKILIIKLCGHSKSIDADVSIGRVKFSLFQIVLDILYLSAKTSTLQYTSKLVHQ